MKKYLLPIDALVVWCPTWSKNLGRTLFTICNLLSPNQSFDCNGKFLRLTIQVLNFVTSRFFALVPLMASLLCQLTDLSREMLTLIYFFLLFIQYLCSCYAWYHKTQGKIRFRNGEKGFLREHSWKYGMYSGSSPYANFIKISQLSVTGRKKKKIA